VRLDVPSPREGHFSKGSINFPKPRPFRRCFNVASTAAGTTASSLPPTLRIPNHVSTTGCSKAPRGLFSRSGVPGPCTAIHGRPKIHVWITISAKRGFGSTPQGGVVHNCIFSNSTMKSTTICTALSMILRPTSGVACA
jgi:hypothetical protein